MAKAIRAFAQLLPPCGTICTRFTAPTHSSKPYASPLLKIKKPTSKKPSTVSRPRSTRARSHQQVPTWSHQQIPTWSHQQVPTWSHQQVPTWSHQQIPRWSHQQGPLFASLDANWTLEMSWDWDESNGRICILQLGTLSL